MAPCKLCRHVMPSGLTCKAPAMRGTAFCYYHGRATRPARPVRPSEIEIELPHLIDVESCLEAINEIVQALAASRISSRRASILLYSVQMSLANLSAGAPSIAPAVDVSQLLSSIGRLGNLAQPNPDWSDSLD
jgi:hypothetical protein